VDGPHRIECRGVDAAGNTQPPPYDGVDVTVDTTPPSVGVPAGAVPSINSLSVVSVPVLVSDATATNVRGVLDGSVDTAVTRVGGGVVSVGVASDGNHTLVLSSEDVAGNVGAVVSVSWYTDRVSPVTSATFAGASRFVRDTTAGVSVSTANEAFPDLCMACWYYTVAAGDGSTLTAASRCESTSSLSFAYTFDGVASVDVYSVDAAGNVGGNASRVTWTWDRTAPDTTVSVDGGVWLSSLYAWAVGSSTALLSVVVSEAASSFAIVTVDGLSLTLIVTGSKVVLRDLSEGVHVVSVAGVDVAGNALRPSCVPAPCARCNPAPLFTL
jgi:hypothetical protein